MKEVLKRHKAICELQVQKKPKLAKKLKKDLRKTHKH